MSTSILSRLLFYRNHQLVTLMFADQGLTLFHGLHLPLAEYRTGEVTDARLLATDRNSSILSVHGGENVQRHTYSSYGHDAQRRSACTLLGFNGARFDLASGCYPLGNGYRSYAPSLMRLLSPDSWSPFKNNQWNAYAYCQGDPINHVDPSGHVRTTPSTLTRPPQPTEGKVFSRPTARFKIDVYETKSVSMLSPVNREWTQAVEPQITIDRKMHTHWVYRVEPPVHMKQSTTYVTDVNIDNYLKISGELNALSFKEKINPGSIGKPVLQNLENALAGLSARGKSLYKQAMDPEVRDVYFNGQGRISPGASGDSVVSQIREA
jgi:RHS repeat-associated protein